MQIKTDTILIILAEKQWSKTTLAEKTGISRQSISIILAKGTCNTVNAGRIAEALDVPVSRIVAV